MLINEGIDKYNDRNTVQVFINNMIGNTNVPTVVESGNKATYMEQDIINDLNIVLLHLRNELGDNINNANNENNYDNTDLADTGLKSNFIDVGTSPTSLVFDFLVCFVLVSLKVLSSPINMCELPGSFSSVGVW